jgi:4-amino-4-deoxy-L-arabinose transferase-like glycosyltransferase
MRRLLTLHNLARLALLALLFFSLEQVDEMKHPSKTAWARHMAEGKNPSVAEHVKAGMWAGAVTRAAIAGLLLVVSLGWPLQRAAPKGNAMNLGGMQASPRVFWTCVGLIVLGALVMRLPRMTHSLWGDEADAVANYVHGMFRPANYDNPQGHLYFERPSWGLTFFSAKHGPNNHVLQSLSSRACLAAWQKLTGAADTAFSEWALRLPSLLAGLGSVVAVACLLRRWGAPALGLLAVLFMALHPWHVRYSTEARGYAMAICLLPLILLVLTNALEKRDWRHWLLFALLEFLVMYAWAGVAYPLAFVNVALLVIMLARGDRWVLVVRWLTASLTAAGAFISLYAPHVPQIKKYTETSLWIKGLPMDAAWLHNLLASPFTGIVFHGQRGKTSAIVSWEKLFDDVPVQTLAGFGLILLCFTAGLVVLWRKDRRIAGLVSSVFLAAIVSALHFKLGLRSELRVWYLLFTLPFLCITVATGLSWMGGLLSGGGDGIRLRAGVTTVLFAVIVVSLWPMNRTLMAHSAEEFRSVVALARGEDEIAHPKEKSDVFTCWLWRFSALYDPRGDKHVRDEAALRNRMKEAEKGSLFVVVGYRSLAEGQNADMLRVLDDPSLFDKVGTYPGYESIQTLEVYRMKPAPSQ